MLPLRALAHRLPPRPCSLARKCLGEASLASKWPQLPQRVSAGSLLARRHQSTAGARDAANKPRYPANLNVFNSGPVPTVTLGLCRVFSIAVFGYGFFWVAPSAFADPNAQWGTTLAMVSLAAMPMIAMGTFFGGYIHHINVFLPDFARRSKDDLMRFASNIPPMTPIEIKSLWFRPWPVTRSLYFEDLRRLPPSALRMSNLEHVPLQSVESQMKHPILAGLVKGLMGRYCVSRRQVKDRSHAPGAFDRMWEQIPFAGEEGKQGTRRAAGTVPYTLANRPSVRAGEKKGAASKSPSRAKR